MNEYYTYAYLREDGTPYYIGKGSKVRKNRKSQRTIPAPTNPNNIITLKQNLTEQEAFRHEIYMIAILGRKDNGTGILRNLTDGGEGTSGRVWSEEQHERHSNNMKGNKIGLGYRHTEESKSKISKANTGKVRTEEQLEKLKQRESKPLVSNPSPKTLYMRKWREKNRQKYEEYQRNYHQSIK